ncbi:MAG: PAS domain S-box protein [Alphaproteobacteria bacterium]|nr:PAS domain S-box protein [Alphaproteobacteria bacterium]
MESPFRPTSFLRSDTEHRPDRRLIAAGGAFLVAIWLSLVFASWLQYESARQQGEVAVSYMARQVEDWTQGALWRIAELSAAAEAQLQGPAIPSDIFATLERHRTADPRLFHRIEMRARDGRPIAALPAAPDGDGEPASEVSEGPTPLSIGLPRQVDGMTLVPVARTLFNRDGQPVAILRIGIPAGRLAGLDGEIVLPNRAAIAILRSDGQILAATPGLGYAGAGGEMIDLDRLDPGRAGGRVAMIRGGDGAMRLVAHRAALRDAPGPRAADDPGLVVVAGLHEDEVFAVADRRTLFFGMIAAAVSILVIAVGRRMTRDRARHADDERRLSIATGAIGAVDASVAIVERTTDGRNPVVAVNPAFGALLARSSDDLLGKPWREVVGDNGVAWLDEVGKALETRFARPDGETSWLEIRVAPIPATALHGPHALVAMHDITQRKQTEMAMLRAKNQAEIANRAKSDFLANMSHELRTPLNAILGFSEIISKQLLGPVGTVAYREYANDIWVSGSHLLNIISDILDFAKIEAATLKLEETEVDLARLVGTCVRFMSARSAQSGVEVLVDIPASFPHLFADDLRLKQIVLNLLSNAVKFSPPRSQVVVRAALTAEGQIDISVVDRGCGMSPSDVEAAMQPFRQIESTMVKRAEGTGLGLPLAKRLVELHGGLLLIDTAPERGTTVTVRLPGARGRASQAAA